MYRLATKGTVEEELLLSADAKRRLEKLVIKKGGFKTMGQKMDLREDLDKETLRALLLKDGQVYKFSNDKEVLSDKEIATLCDRYDACVYSILCMGSYTDGNVAGVTRPMFVPLGAMETPMASRLSRLVPTVSQRHARLPEESYGVPDERLCIFLA